MGRAAGVSCFRVIICGKDINREVVPRQASENKGSSGRKWSFRKRSTTQTFMSSVVISEPVLVNNECSETIAPDFDSSFNMSTVVISEPVLVNNECSETGAPNFEALSNITLPEQQISLIQETEVKTEPLSQPNPTEPDNIACITNDCISDVVFEEYSIVFIQAAIRGFLGRRLILKQTSVIKLQAAVRGYLVRRKANAMLRSSVEKHPITLSDSAVLNISVAESITETNHPEIESLEVAESANMEIKDGNSVAYSSLDKEDIGTDGAKNLPTMESNPLFIATGSRVDGHSSYYGSETEASEAEKDHGTPRIHGTRTRARKSESSRYTMSVPSYMKSTESARYRTSVASGSPKFSSDVLDMSRYIGRRSSTDGNERYPCVLRSLHRSQKYEEGTATHSPKVVSRRKWIR